MDNQILIIDGYIDTPACLGVPPYISPMARYLYGAIFYATGKKPQYITIDQFRNSLKSIKNQIFPKKKVNRSERKLFYNQIIKTVQDYFQNYDVILTITGVSVPGKYLIANPIKFSELKHFKNYFPYATKILCGPATNYGIGEEGGKPSRPVKELEKIFNYIIIGDVEIGIMKNFHSFTQNHSNIEKASFIEYSRQNINDINEIAILGSGVVKQHPNFRESDGGNLICEIETFSGCPRFRSGGCSFCIEPSKGPTQHRHIEAIVNEITQLYEKGVRHFRLGNQADFYAFQHKEWKYSRYPEPNPQAIHDLLKSIRIKCPNIKTLHIDNVNPLNFVLFPTESKKITQIIVKYCTPGNIAALGVESLDPQVIKKNNLKVDKEEIMTVIKEINKIGSKIGENGVSCFLPGLNFIMGLPGETIETLELNFKFLNELIEQDLLIRRINLRKYLVSTHQDSSYRQKIYSHLKKFQSNYYHWRKNIRENIDHKLLQKVFPYGSILKNVYSEKFEGKNTLLRQIGTYPIICYVPELLPLNRFYNLQIIDHGFRSITCLRSPINLPELSLKELEAIPGIGKKRAQSILLQKPKTTEEWISLLGEDLWRGKIQPLNIK